jgi:hypothetical protein
VIRTGKVVLQILRVLQTEGRAVLVRHYISCNYEANEFRENEIHFTELAVLEQTLKEVDIATV